MVWAQFFRSTMRLLDNRKRGGANRNHAFILRVNNTKEVPVPKRVTGIE
jgi:hypothetical protein